MSKQAVLAPNIEQLRKIENRSDKYQHDTISKSIKIRIEELPEKLRLDSVIEYGEYGDVYVASSKGKKYFVKTELTLKTPKEFFIYPEMMAFCNTLGAHANSALRKHYLRKVGYASDETWKIVFFEPFVGANLSDIRRYHIQGNFTPGDAYFLSAQLYVIIENMHTVGWVHGDLTPSSFSLGLGKSERIVYLTHFGRLRRWADKKTGKPRAARASVPYMPRNTTYSSRAAHRRADYCRRDDLESWLYISCDLFDENSLPWKPKLITERAKEELILKQKELFFKGNDDIRGQVFRYFPKELAKLVSTIKEMKWESHPNIEIFHEQIAEARKQVGEPDFKFTNHGKTQYPPPVRPGEAEKKSKEKEKEKKGEKEKKKEKGKGKTKETKDEKKGGKKGDKKDGEKGKEKKKEKKESEEKKETIQKEEHRPMREKPKELSRTEPTSEDEMRKTAETPKSTMTMTATSTSHASKKYVPKNEAIVQVKKKEVKKIEAPKQVREDSVRSVEENTKEMFEKEGAFEKTKADDEPVQIDRNVVKFDIKGDENLVKNSQEFEDLPSVSTDDFDALRMADLKTAASNDLSTAYSSDMKTAMHKEEKKSVMSTVSNFILGKPKNKKKPKAPTRGPSVTDMTTGTMKTKDTNEKKKNKKKKRSKEPTTDEDEDYNKKKKKKKRDDKTEIEEASGKSKKKKKKNKKKKRETEEEEEEEVKPKKNKKKAKATNDQDDSESRRKRKKREKEKKERKKRSRDDESDEESGATQIMDEIKRRKKRRADKKKRRDDETAFSYGDRKKKNKRREKDREEETDPSAKEERKRKKKRDERNGKSKYDDEYDSNMSTKSRKNKKKKRENRKKRSRDEEDDTDISEQERRTMKRIKKKREEKRKRREREREDDQDSTRSYYKRRERERDGRRGRREKRDYRRREEDRTERFNYRRSSRDYGGWDYSQLCTGCIKSERDNRYRRGYRRVRGRRDERDTWESRPIRERHNDYDRRDRRDHHGCDSRVQYSRCHENCIPFNRGCTTRMEERDRCGRGNREGRECRHREDRTDERVQKNERCYERCGREDRGCEVMKNETGKRDETSRRDCKTVDCRRDYKDGRSDRDCNNSRHGDCERRDKVEREERSQRTSTNGHKECERSGRNVEDSTRSGKYSGREGECRQTDDRSQTRGRGERKERYTCGRDYRNCGETRSQYINQQRCERCRNMRDSPCGRGKERDTGYCREDEKSGCRMARECESVRSGRDVRDRRDERSERDGRDRSYRSYVDSRQGRDYREYGRGRNGRRREDERKIDICRCSPAGETMNVYTAEEIRDEPIVSASIKKKKSKKEDDDSGKSDKRSKKSNRRRADSPDDEVDTPSQSRKQKSKKSKSKKREKKEKSEDGSEKYSRKSTKSTKKKTSKEKKKSEMKEDESVKSKTSSKPVKEGKKDDDSDSKQRKEQKKPEKDIYMAKDGQNNQEQSSAPDPSNSKHQTGVDLGKAENKDEKSANVKTVEAPKKATEEISVSLKDQNPLLDPASPTISSPIIIASPAPSVTALHAYKPEEREGENAAAKPVAEAPKPKQTPDNKEEGIEKAAKPETEEKEKEKHEDDGSGSVDIRGVALPGQ